METRIKTKRLVAAAERLQRRAGGMLDAAIVLGSGLADGVLERIDGREIAYAKLYAPVLPLAGHPGIAVAGTWAGKRVAAFAGRAHLYQGYGVQAVTYFVRLAAASGAKTIVLTNAAGGLNPAFGKGDVMLISDHINLTGETAVERSRSDPFLNMTDAYAPHLRALAREHAGVVRPREGIYAGVRGPQYETPAESEALRRLGADAVGMSTVLETMMARSLGLEVLGLSLITNVIDAQSEVSHDEVLAASRAGGSAVAGVIEGVLGAL
jgi:purine-nucleoside phosphorylase